MPLNSIRSAGPVTPAPGTRVRDYTPVDRKYTLYDEPVRALRTFVYHGVPSALVVNESTLESQVVSVDVLAPRSDAWPTRYSRAVNGVARQHLALSGASGKPRVAMTIDMCQSGRAWNRELFEDLIRRGPLTVGVAMTSLWARQHPRELAQLIAWNDSGALRIVWINHSDTHPVGADARFLTADNVDMRAQVLGLEQTLLEAGAVPSMLFRFPGLTHDDRRMRELTDLGLVALDADAWLAKRQPVRDESVILVHGNGNEPSGIKKYFEWVKAADVVWTSPLLVEP